MATQTVRARIEEPLREEASKILMELGLSMSDAIRMLFTRIVADGGLPDGLTKVNEATLLAIKEGREMISTNNLRFSTAEDLLNALEEEIRG